MWSISSGHGTYSWDVRQYPHRSAAAARTRARSAAAIGAAIGNAKLSYQKFPAFLVEQGIKQLGIPKKTAGLMTEMHEAGNDGLLNPQEPRSEKNTTPTSIEAFAKEVFAPAYKAKAATA